MRATRSVRARVRARLAVALALAVLTGVAAVPPAGADTATERFLVTVRASAPSTTSRTLAAAIGRDGVRVVRTYATLPVVAVEATDAARRQLEASPDVLSVVSDGRLFADQTAAPAAPPTSPGAVDAAALPIATGAGWTVAVLDTGVDTTHPYLAGRSGTGVDGLGDGGACFADDCPGSLKQGDPTFGTAAAMPCAVTGCEHGTHVAGIAVGDTAQASVSGAAGVAPGAGLYPVRVFSTTTDPECPSVPCARESDVLAGLDHVAQQAAHYRFAAVNMSLGDSERYTSPCDGVNEPLETAIRTLSDAGIAVVVSAGNLGWTDGVSFPSCVDASIAVGAQGLSGNVASFSNASPKLALVAPGTNITSSLPGGGFGPKSGTSMAAPAVAGAFALVREAAAPQASLNELLDLLRTTGPVVADNRLTFPESPARSYPALDVDAALAILGFAGPGTAGGGIPGTFRGLSTPQRLVDTRAAIGGTRLPAGTGLAVNVPGAPSTTATAGASLNVTAVGADAPGFLTVYPCGQATPIVSSVNYVAAVPVANKVVVAVPPGGQVCIFTMSATDVVVDLDGWIPADQPFHAVTPHRVLDTRQTSGPVTDIAVPVAPAGATGAVVNVTVTEPSAAGFATLYPCGQAPPLASNLNFVAGATVPGAALVPVDAAGRVCVHTSSPAQVIVDVAGWLGVGFTPVVPFRAIDTRLQGPPVTDIALTAGPLGSMAGIALTLTVTEPTAAGYATVYPCGQAPPVASNVNFVAGQTMANAVVATPDAQGQICVHALVPTHLVVDISGGLS